jgi:hypothetical protein
MSISKTLILSFEKPDFNLQPKYGGVQMRKILRLIQKACVLTHVKDTLRMLYNF